MADIRLKRQIIRLTRKWRDRLWLGYWRISPRFTDELESDGSLYSEGHVALARAQYHPEYREAEITWALSEAKNDKHLNRAAAHEMIHVAMSPLVNLTERILNELPQGKSATYAAWVTQVNEEVTEQMANALLDAFGEIEKPDLEELLNQ